MAEKRMLSKSIIDSDDFIAMPVSARMFYIDLAIRADDDGFIAPRRVMRMTGASDDDLRCLIAKHYVIPFNTGVLVISHWLIHNTLRKDSYKPTLYIREKGLLRIPSKNSPDRTYKVCECSYDAEVYPLLEYK